MRTKSKNIPVNTLPAESSPGIMVMRESFDGRLNFEEVERSHRDDGYTFIMQEEGTTYIEVDFQTYCLQASSLIYLQPDQVHRVIKFEKATISTWIITEENIRPEYLNLLNSFAPVNAIPLDQYTVSLIAEVVLTSMKLSRRKEEKLYHAILKENSNTLVALVASQYLVQPKTTDHYHRYEVITKAFKRTLEQHFRTIKYPVEYAGKLNLSTSYLNECVKGTTGQSVTRHIQHRVVLEAKRLLYHSSKSVKEIAAELGYDDCSYFTRLFVKIVKMTPSVFRDKNRV